MANVRAAPDDHLLTLELSRALRSVTAAVLILATPASALGADPTPDPAATPRPPTCAERFPEEGPAGVDLRLGCIVGEVVGLYTTAQQAPPAPLSTYLIALALVIVCALFVTFLAGRVLARRAGRRLAPVLAGEWWVCATCHSVNGAGVAHCYSCGATPPDGPMLRTDAEPLMPQSFGSTRKRG